MASIKISNTQVETNLANIEGLVGYRTNPTTQDLETVQITGNYVGGNDPTAPKQGFISTKPFTIYENESDIQEFPGNSNRSIVSYSGIETYGNLEVFTQTGIASFIGQGNTILKSNTGDVTIETAGSPKSVQILSKGMFNATSEGGMTINAKGGTTTFSNTNVLASSFATILINTIGSSNNAGHIEIQSAGSASNNKGIILKSATDIQVDLHSTGSGNTPVVGQALIAKDTDGNIEFGNGVVLSQTAAGTPNSGLRYSSIGNNGLQVNGITARGIKVTTSQTSGVQVDFSGVTTTANKSSIGAPMLAVIQAADATAARTVLDVDQAGTDNSIPVTLAGDGAYLTVSNNQITQSKIDLAEQDNSTSNFAKASEIQFNVDPTVLPEIKMQLGTNIPGQGFTSHSQVTLKPETNGGLNFNGSSGGNNSTHPITLDLDNLDASNPPNGSNVGSVGILMGAANETDGDKLQFKTNPQTNLVTLESAPQSPDIVCVLDGNTNLANMDSGNAYVVPFNQSAQSSSAYYVFNPNSGLTSGTWDSYVQIGKDGRYQINAKVGMYNANKNNPVNPTLTIWIVVSEDEPTGFGTMVAPTDTAIPDSVAHCIGSCQINRDVNGLGLVQGSTMLNLLKDQYITVVVRPDGFSGQDNSGSGGLDERAYFVYNNVEISTGNFLHGHRPQLEIYRID